LIINNIYIKVHRILKYKSSITIVTDDKNYCNLIANEFSFLNNLFKSSFEPLLFINEIPEGYGSSYFDRMWKNGKRVSRYFLKFIKIN
jgi:hypothetical protein